MKERDLKEKCYMEALDGSISNVKVVLNHMKKIDISVERDVIVILIVFAIIKSATTIKATTKIAPPLRTDSRISTNLFVEEPP